MFAIGAVWPKTCIRVDALIPSQRINSLINYVQNDLVVYAHSGHAWTLLLQAAIGIRNCRSKNIKYEVFIVFGRQTLMDGDCNDTERKNVVKCSAALAFGMQYHTNKNSFPTMPGHLIYDYRLRKIRRHTLTHLGYFLFPLFDTYHSICRQQKHPGAHIYTKTCTNTHERIYIHT